MILASEHSNNSDKTVKSGGKSNKTNCSAPSIFMKIIDNKIYLSEGKSS